MVSKVIWGDTQFSWVPPMYIGGIPVIKILFGDFPGGTVVKNPPANAGHTGSSPGPGRSHMLRGN